MTWEQARQLMRKIADLFPGGVDVSLNYSAKTITVNYAPESRVRELARMFAQSYAHNHPEFDRVLTAGERREQYADHYARTIMRLTA